MAPYRDRPDWLRRLNRFGPATGAPDAIVPLDPDELLALARRTTGLEDIGRHYALTLKHWRRNFFAQIDRVRALGYPEEFIRMWEFYLTYCEGAFADRAIGDVLLVAEKPAHPT